MPCRATRAPPKPPDSPRSRPRPLVSSNSNTTSHAELGPLLRGLCSSSLRSHSLRSLRVPCLLGVLRSCPLGVLRLLREEEVIFAYSACSGVSQTKYGVPSQKPKVQKILSTSRQVLQLVQPVQTSSAAASLQPCEFPWRPTKGGVGIRRTRRIASACLQGCSVTLGSVGSILSKATLLQLPESVNKQTNKQTCKQSGQPAIIPSEPWTD